MEYSKPTEKDPLLFFITTFLKGGLKSLYNSFVNYWRIGQEYDESIFIDYDNQYVIHSLGQNDDGIDISIREYFHDNLNEIIKSATEEAVDKIKERIGTILLNQESILTFLLEQRNIVNLILEYENDAIQKYAALNDSILKLNSVLSELAIKYKVKDYFLSDDFTDRTAITVNNIIGYLGRTNWEGQQIMVERDYSQMINDVFQIINSETDVSSGRKFSQLLIPNGLLYFTFYVLYKEIGRRELRMLFIKFIVNRFIQTDITEFSLNRKFNRRPGYLYPGNWLPDIIRNYARSANP